VGIRRRVGVLIRINGLKSRKDEKLAERANCVIALRSEGVSLLLDISGGQLPATCTGVRTWERSSSRMLKHSSCPTLTLPERTSLISRSVSQYCLNTGPAGWVVQV
jgi:hypothetical protein